jgi:hypothetical protein
LESKEGRGVKREEKEWGMEKVKEKRDRERKGGKEKERRKW